MGKKLAGVLFVMIAALTALGLTFTEPESADAAGNLPSAVLSKEISPSEASDVSLAEMTEQSSDSSQGVPPNSDILSDTQINASAAESDVSPSESLAGSSEAVTVNFTAELQFNSATDDHVMLRLTNLGEERLNIAPQAHYMDQLGSAGSWDCAAERETAAGPGETIYVDFYMDQAVAHGENSILAFYIQYQGQWYLAKVGERNGIECFLRHD